MVKRKVDEAEKERLLDWQRRLDPSKYVKSTAAQYKTAPSVIMPDSAEYPSRVPKESVTIGFFVDGASWVAGDEKVEARKSQGIEFVEKPPKSKRAKHGPVVMMDKDRVFGIVTASDNYYYSAYECSKHPLLYACFRPGKVNKETGKRKIYCVVTFMPEDKA